MWVFMVWTRLFSAFFRRPRTTSTTLTLLMSLVVTSFRFRSRSRTRMCFVAFMVMMVVFLFPSVLVLALVLVASIFIFFSLLFLVAFIFLLFPFLVLVFGLGRIFFRRRWRGHICYFFLMCSLRRCSIQSGKSSFIFAIWNKKNEKKNTMLHWIIVWVWIIVLSLAIKKLESCVKSNKFKCLFSLSFLFGGVVQVFRFTVLGLKYGSYETVESMVTSRQGVIEIEECELWWWTTGQATGLPRRKQTLDLLESEARRSKQK